MIEIKKDTKLHEIVLLDPTIITVFYRFGIVLGLSDSTVESICEEKKIDIDFFLAILDVYKRQAENNLKGIDVKFPLGVMTVVTGVSGSGKSTLVDDILYRALARHFGENVDAPGTFASLEGDLNLISGVEMVDQNPIGKSSRSNPATYLKAFDEIRSLYAQQQLSKHCLLYTSSSSFFIYCGEKIVFSTFKPSSF